MAAASKIEWTEHTWNPFAGCAVLSPGCANCYAMKMASRLDAMGRPLYKGLTKPSKAGPVWRGTVRANPDVLMAPLKRKTPTTYFVNSMSDLFYEKFSDELIDQVFAVMALTPQHTYQLPTKRARRMREYCSALNERAVEIAQRAVWLCIWDDPDIAASDTVTALDQGFLSNVWLGVSTERQQEADERIPHLLGTPAAVRFISAEPLLGAVDLTRLTEPCNDTVRDALRGEYFVPGCGSVSSKTFRGNRLDWVIVGGESGKNARPMHPQWARDLRDQCAQAGVPFFFKQWGQHGPTDLRGFAQVTTRCGKKAAGRLLDGIEHNDMPRRSA